MPSIGHFKGISWSIFSDYFLCLRVFKIQYIIQFKISAFSSCYNENQPSLDRQEEKRFFPAPVRDRPLFSPSSIFPYTAAMMIRPSFSSSSSLILENLSFMRSMEASASFRASDTLAFTASCNKIINRMRKVLCLRALTGRKRPKQRR